MAPQKIQKWLYQIYRTLSYFKLNMFPLRQKTIKCIINELEGDDSDLMLGCEPQKATVCSEWSRIVVEQERLEAWTSLLIYFNLVEILPLGILLSPLIKCSICRTLYRFLQDPGSHPYLWRACSLVLEIKHIPKSLKIQGRLSCVLLGKFKVLWGDRGEGGERVTWWQKKRYFQSTYYYNK